LYNTVAAHIIQHNSRPLNQLRFQGQFNVHYPQPISILYYKCQIFYQQKVLQLRNAVVINF